MNQQRSLVIRAELWLLAITVFWSATFPVIKNALGDISPTMFLAIRFSIATLVLLPFTYKTLRNLNAQSFRDSGWLTLTYFLGFILQIIGLQYTSATKSAFITGTFVVLTPFFQAVIEKRMPDRGSLIGVFMVFIGILLLAGQHNGITGFLSELGGSFNIGDFLTFLCAVFYSIYIVQMDMISHKYDVKFLTLMQLMLTAALAIGSAIVLPVVGLGTTVFNPTTAVIAALLYTALFASILTTFIQTRFQKYTTPTKAGIIFSFEPIFATILAVAFFSETITPIGVAGGVLIFAGILTSELVK